MNEQQQQNRIKVLNTEELQEFWDDFSLNYSEKVAPNMAPMYISMMNMLDIENSDSILETAVGSGYLVPHLISRKKNDTPLYLTDISNKLLSLTQRRVQLLNENKTEDLYSIKLNEIQPYSAPQKFDRFNTHIQYANGESLTNFQNNSIQSYISSLCLQLTTDPNQMIKETYRVLKPGGKACFSVWGSPQNSPQLSLVPRILQEKGVKLPNARSNFHLNDKEKLIEMFESQGFENVLCWTQFLPSSQLKSEYDIEQFLKFQKVTDLIELSPKEKKEEYKNIIKEAYMEILQKQKTSIGFEALLILVSKPKP